LPNTTVPSPYLKAVDVVPTVASIEERFATPAVFCKVILTPERNLADVPTVNNLLAFAVVFDDDEAAITCAESFPAHLSVVVATRAGMLSVLNPCDKGDQSSNKVPEIKAVIRILPSVVPVAT